MSLVFVTMFFFVFDVLIHVDDVMAGLILSLKILDPWLLPSACPHRAYTRALKIEKSLTLPIPVGGGAVDTNDWCISIGKLPPGTGLPRNSVVRITPDMY